MAVQHNIFYWYDISREPTPVVFGKARAIEHERTGGVSAVHTVEENNQYIQQNNRFAM